MEFISLILKMYSRGYGECGCGSREQGGGGRLLKIPECGGSEVAASAFRGLLYELHSFECRRGYLRAISR